MSVVSRLSWRLRERFEKWLWQGSVDGKRIRHFLAVHLPWYLSDVEAHYLRKRERNDPDFWDKFERTTGPPTLRIIGGVAHYKDVSGHPLMVQGYIDAMASQNTAAAGR